MSVLFHRNLRLLLLTFLLILAWGISSYLSLPRLEDPLLDKRHALVTTSFPGASTQRVEALVTEKLEEELFEISEIETIESTSKVGLSTIYLQLDDNVKKTDEVWSRVRDQIDDTIPELPPGALSPQFKDLEIRAYGAIIGLNWQLKETPNYAILGRFAEELKIQLLSISGTEKIDLFGKPDEEIVVEIEPSELTTLGLSSKDLSEKIQDSDTKIATGQLRSASNDILLEMKGELNSLEKIRNVPLRISDEGQFVRLGDIAEVKKGIVQPPL